MLLMKELNIMQQKTDQEIYNFCKAKYYDLNNNKCKSFEYWDCKDIEEAIQNDVKDYKKFMMN